LLGTCSNVAGENIVSVNSKFPQKINEVSFKRHPMRQSVGQSLAVMKH
jgi:hypothetical protein